MLSRTSWSARCSLGFAHHSAIRQHTTTASTHAIHAIHPQTLTGVVRICTMKRSVRSLGHAFLALAAATLALDDAFAAATCTTLSNKDSTFMSALVTMGVISDADLTELTAAGVFANVDATMPWLSTCAAAIDPVALVVEAMTSTTLASCSAALNTTSSALSSNMTGATFKDTLCPRYNDTVIPCVVDGIVGIATRTMDVSGGCCDAFAAKIKDWSGNDLKTMATLLVQYIGNILCAHKTVSGATQYCGFSLMTAMDSSTTSAITTNPLALLNIAQIPNAQVCSALSGAAFTTTLGVTATLPIAQTNDVGICFRPVDLLLQHVRDYPLMKTYAMVKDDSTSVPVSNLFADGKCVPGDVLVEWLARASNPAMTILGAVDAFISTMSSSPPPSKPLSSGSAATGTSGSVSYNTSAGSSSAVASEDSRSSSTNITASFASLLKMVKTTAKAFCFHLPNSATCAYTGQTIVYPYTSVAPAASTGTSAAAAGVVGASTSALALLVLANVVALSTFVFA